MSLPSYALHNNGKKRDNGKRIIIQQVCVMKNKAIRVGVCRVVREGFSEKWHLDRDKKIRREPYRNLGEQYSRKKEQTVNAKPLGQECAWLIFKEQHGS